MDRTFEMSALTKTVVEALAYAAWSAKRNAEHEEAKVFETLLTKIEDMKLDVSFISREL